MLGLGLVSNAQRLVGRMRKGRIGGLKGCRRDFVRENKIGTFL